MVGLGDCVRLLNCNQKTEIYVVWVVAFFWLVDWGFFNQTRKNTSMHEILAALPSRSEKQWFLK